MSMRGSTRAIHSHTVPRLRARWWNHWVSPGLVHVPNGALSTIREAGHEYDRMIEEAGGVDIQILGIGTDGHIGFNEPGSSLASGTRIKTLTQQTREDNARFFDNDIDKVPTLHHAGHRHNHEGAAPHPAGVW